MDNCTFEKTGNIGILAFQGSLTESSVKDLKLALIRSIHNTDNLFLNFAEVTDIDCSCLKLLCSAYKISKKMDKRVSMLGVCHKVLNTVIKKTGYSCSNDCAGYAQKECFLKSTWACTSQGRAQSTGKPLSQRDRICV